MDGLEDGFGLLGVTLRVLCAAWVARIAYGFLKAKMACNWAAGFGCLGASLHVYDEKRPCRFEFVLSRMAATEPPSGSAFVSYFVRCSQPSPHQKMTVPGFPFWYSV